MHRWLIAMTTFLVAAAAVIAGGFAAPPAHAGDAPIGRIGDTLRVDTGDYVADVTVSSVAPCDPPPGFGYTRSGAPVKSFEGSSVNRADVTIRAVRVPNPYIMATNFSFDGVTPYADASMTCSSVVSSWLPRIHLPLKASRILSRLLTFCVLCICCSMVSIAFSLV